MIKNKKRENLKLIFLGFVFLFIGSQTISGQTIKQTFDKAANYYWDDDYEMAFETISPILDSFEQQEDYWKNNPELVFKVFKLITESFYELGMDDDVDEAESMLIDFFAGQYTPNQVIDRLDNTEI